MKIPLLFMPIPDTTRKAAIFDRQIRVENKIAIFDRNRDGRI